MNTRGFALLGLLLTACAGSHSDNDGAAGSAVTAAGKSGSTGNPAGSAGTDVCKRKPTNHRAEDQMCDHERDPSTPGAPMEPAVGCTSDADCTQGENGRCGFTTRGGRTCTYDECFADADCKQAGPCVCATDGHGPNRCFMGECRTDADCGANGYCSPSFGSCGRYAGVVAYFCHSCQDECFDDADCSGDGTAGEDHGYCAYEPTVGRWKCSTSFCVG